MVRKIKIAFLIFSGIGLALAVFTIFFDQAVLVRRNTFYKADVAEKVVALTFDDGPSAIWTPKILDALKVAGVKATFFMLGKYVQKDPDAAKRVAAEGHEIGNHTYDHHVLLYYTDAELAEEVRQAEEVIRDVTGVTTRLFRPPKAWVTENEKRELRDLGYEVVLWTLNSKDWVTFDDKYMIRYIVKNINPGDIILFHDNGGVFSTEGGNRNETVKTIPRLVEKLKEKGYRFVTVGELLRLEQKGFGSANKRSR